MRTAAYRTTKPPDEYSAALFDFRRGQNQYRPILLKISPDLPDPLIDEVTDLMLSTPLDGIVAVNGTFSRKGISNR